MNIDSWQSNESCVSTPNLARFVVQKIGIKDAVVPSADFLLESELRGSPPKSEKAAAFWRVGGAGRGVQPFLREKTGESKSKKIVSDSRIAKMDSSRYRAQNDEFVDCFGQSPRNDSIISANPRAIRTNHANLLG